jgi:phosphoribosylamine--glycine ligase
MSTCVQPTLDYLSQLGIDFRGVLYAGLMLTPNGPKMLEYNVRFGDPETQVVLPRLTSSLTELLLQAANGQPLAEPQFSPDAAVTVVCASEGYPTGPRTGDEIHGVEQAQALDGVTVYAAGVAMGDSGQLVTGGGRVLNITATGPTLDAARQRAYQAAELITWPGKQVRSDIAEQAAKQQEMSS